MISVEVALLILLLWLKFHLVQNQCWSGYNYEPYWDSYSQSYNYPYGQSAYDYNAYSPSVYVSNYPQQNPYDYYQQSMYNSYSNDPQYPIVIVVNGSYDDDDDWDLIHMISALTSLNDKPDNGPIYIPYPVPVPCCNCNGNSDCNYRLDVGYSDCCCKNAGCDCCNCDTCYDSDCYCEKCSKGRKKRPKSKCARSTGSGCSNSGCCCSKCIKHKNDRCFRD